MRSKIFKLNTLATKNINQNKNIMCNSKYLQKTNRTNLIINFTYRIKIYIYIKNKIESVALMLLLKNKHFIYNLILVFLSNFFFSQLLFQQNFWRKIIMCIELSLVRTSKGGYFFSALNDVMCKTFCVTPWLFLFIFLIPFINKLKYFIQVNKLL